MVSTVYSATGKASRTAGTSALLIKKRHGSALRVPNNVSGSKGVEVYAVNDVAVSTQ
jgi:hypothetical protein